MLDFLEGVGFAENFIVSVGRRVHFLAVGCLALEREIFFLAVSAHRIFMDVIGFSDSVHSATTGLVGSGDIDIFLLFVSRCVFSDAGDKNGAVGFADSIGLGEEKSLIFLCFPLAAIIVELIFFNFSHHLKQTDFVMGLKAAGDMFHQENVERHKVTDEHNRQQVIQLGLLEL